MFPRQGPWEVYWTDSTIYPGVLITHKQVREWGLFSRLFAGKWVSYPASYEQNLLVVCTPLVEKSVCLLVSKRFPPSYHIDCRSHSLGVWLCWVFSLNGLGTQAEYNTVPKKLGLWTLGFRQRQVREMEHSIQSILEKKKKPRSLSIPKKSRPRYRQADQDKDLRL